MSAELPEPSFERTYKLSTGEQVWGEFGWVTELDFFDDLDEPVELIEETWQRTSVKRIWRFPDPICCQVEDDQGVTCEGEAIGWWRENDDDDWIEVCPEHDLEGVQRP